MNLGRNDDCWCGSGKKYKRCHMALEEKIADYAREGHLVPERAMLKTPEQIAGIKESAAINTALLDYISQHMEIGMSTGDIDRLVDQFTRSHGAVPAPYQYNGFPKSVCTSLNDQVCHGIPDDQTFLQQGDIINVDVSTIFHGYFSDASRMFMMGSVSAEAERIVRIARECMERGVAALKPWGFLGDMGEAINSYAMQNGYSVVREIGGHGVGLEFHESPYVSYVSQKGTDMLLVPGMIFTVEPMINGGTHEVVEDEDNGWTIYTADGQLSAQWECTVLVTDTGIEILTI